MGIEVKALSFITKVNHACFGAFVLFPPLSLVFATFELKVLGTAHLVYWLIVPWSCHYLPPAKLFGEPLFTIGIGAGPNGPIGLGLAAVLYSIPFVFVAIVLRFARKRNQPSLPAAARGYFQASEVN